MLGNDYYRNGSHEMAIINCIVRKEKGIVVYSNPKYILSLLLIFGRYFHLALLSIKKKKSPKYETAKYSFEFINTISNKWKHVLSNNVGIHIVKKQLLKGRVCFNIEETTS